MGRNHGQPNAMDPRGMKGSWESLVFYVNPEKTEQIRKLATDAQWFEDRMPWAAQYRKQGVRGITANAIDVVIETGDSGPITPVGINLPNDQNVREKHGSKSVSLSNVTEAYDRSTAPEFRREFSWTAEEAARAEKWSSVAAELTTNMNAHDGAGFASLRTGDAAAAAGHFGCALALFPEHARSLVGLGAALAASGDSAGADEAFTRAEGCIESLRRGGRGSEATLAAALHLAARSEEDAALHTLHELLDRADLPFTGWTIPIEPLLERVRQLRGYAGIAAQLAERAR